MTTDRAVTLMCRIDDIFVGEDMDDVRRALTTLSGAYLMDRDFDDIIAFLVEVLMATKGCVEASKVTNKADYEEALHELERRMTGH